MMLEVLLIMLVALVVLGPEKWIQSAWLLGKAWVKLRTYQQWLHNCLQANLFAQNKAPNTDSMHNDSTPQE